VRRLPTSVSIVLSAGLKSIFAFKLVISDDILLIKEGDTFLISDIKPFFAGIFNGFGSKGVSLSPYFAKQWTDEILTNSSVHPEASIRRFYHLFSV
jgi:ascorbate-specific PTS system EIIC-type component UlaA